MKEFLSLMISIIVAIVAVGLIVLAFKIVLSLVWYLVIFGLIAAISLPVYFYVNKKLLGKN
ncbi:MAG: hypothetical protein RO257_06165 [Candidatus Kapabacteria bacterium]|nr:hypothetical protein [Candidatus Kapabacteria bacterium]